MIDILIAMQEMMESFLAGSYDENTFFYDLQGLYDSIYQTLALEDRAFAQLLLSYVHDADLFDIDSLDEKHLIAPSLYIPQTTNMIAAIGGKIKAMTSN